MTGCIQAISAKQIGQYARLRNTVWSVNAASHLTAAIIRKRVHFAALNGQLTAARNWLHSIAVTESDLGSQRGTDGQRMLSLASDNTLADRMGLDAGWSPPI